MCLDLCAILTCLSCSATMGLFRKTWTFIVMTNSIRPNWGLSKPTERQWIRHRCVCKREILFVLFFRMDGSASLSEGKTQCWQWDRQGASNDSKANTRLLTHALSTIRSCALRVSSDAYRCTLVAWDVCGKIEVGLVTTRYKCLQLELIQ